MDRRELFKAVAVTGALGATSTFAGAAGARADAPTADDAMPHELFKMTAHFDGTARNPAWLGGDTPLTLKLAPPNGG